MDFWIFYIMLFFLNLKTLTNVSKRNELKNEANMAFVKKDFVNATEKYQILEAISFNLEPEARLNLAHCYFYVKDTANALLEYKKLLKINDPLVAATAYNQLGILNAMLGDSVSALACYKETLKLNPENEVAKYNYELIKKRNPESDKLFSQKNKNRQTQSEENQEFAKTEKKEDELQTLAPKKMSKEKALEILDAMKLSELQFVHQMKVSNGGNPNQFNSR